MKDYANLISKQLASFCNQYIFVFFGTATLCHKGCVVPPPLHAPAPSGGLTTYLADGRTL